MEYSLFYLADQYERVPRSNEQLYKQIIEQSILAESLGYHGVYLAEHHVNDFGVIPSPAILLTSIAMRTTHLKLGTAISILPLHHPLAIAEQYAMLDIISQGRVELGLGSGFLDYEFTAFDKEVADKRELFNQSLETLTQLYNQTRSINVLPYQGREMPLYISGLSNDSAYYIGKQGHHLLSAPYNQYISELDAPATIIKNYKKGRAESSNTETPGQVRMMFFCHVAETDEAARAHIAEAFGRYNARRRFEDETDINLTEKYDKWLSKGLLLSGSVDTVCKKLKRLKTMGLTHIITLQNFGGVDEAHIFDSMERFAKQVIPQLEETCHV